MVLLCCWVLVLNRDWLLEEGWGLAERWESERLQVYCTTGESADL